MTREGSLTPLSPDWYLELPTWIFAIWGQFIFCPEEIVEICYNVKKLKIMAVVVMMMMLMFLMMMMPLLLNWRWPPPPPFPHIGMQMRCVPGDPTMVTSTAFAAFRQNLAKRAALVDDGGRGHQTWISTPSCSRTESSEGVQLNVLQSTLLHNCDCRILRILLKQNTALLSTVRLSVCVCVTGVTSLISHI